MAFLSRLKAWLSPAIVPEEAPEVLGPFADRAQTELQAKEADERYSDYLNAYKGYFETQQREDGWYAVRVLGSTTASPPSVQWTAGLGPM